MSIFRASERYVIHKRIYSIHMIESGKAPGFFERPKRVRDLINVRTTLFQFITALSIEFLLSSEYRMAISHF